MVRRVSRAPGKGAVDDASGAAEDQFGAAMQRSAINETAKPRAKVMRKSSDSGGDQEGNPEDRTSELAAENVNKPPSQLRLDVVSMAQSDGAVGRSRVRTNAQGDSVSTRINTSNQAGEVATSTQADLASENGGPVKGTVKQEASKPEDASPEDRATSTVTADGTGIAPTTITATTAPQPEANNVGPDAENSQGDGAIAVSKVTDFGTVGELDNPVSAVTTTTTLQAANQPEAIVTTTSTTYFTPPQAVIEDIHTYSASYVETGTPTLGTMQSITSSWVSSGFAVMNLIDDMDPTSLQQDEKDKRNATGDTVVTDISTDGQGSGEVQTTRIERK